MTGVFARYVGTTKRTVQFYDKKDLFKPKYVDESGYRFYEPHQVIDFEALSLLTKLGFPLKELKTLDNKTGSLKEVFGNKQKEVENEIGKLQKKLFEIKSYYENLEKYGSLVAPVVKLVQPYNYYFIVVEGPYSKMGEYFSQLKNGLMSIPQKATYLSTFEGNFDPKKARMRIGVIDNGKISIREETKDKIKRGSFAAYRALSYIHRGPVNLLALLWREMSLYRKKFSFALNPKIPYFLELNRFSPKEKYSETDGYTFELQIPIL